MPLPRRTAHRRLRGREPSLIAAGEAAALVGAGLPSVLSFPAAGLALLRRHPQPKGSAMQTQCSAYTTDAEAQAEVERLLAAGVPEDRISVLVGHMPADHRRERVGAFAGDAGAVGTFAGAAGASADAMGSFAGNGDQRRGAFGDADRDEVVTYASGVRRVHVASHHELARRLADAGLGADAVAAEVEALHDGRALVLVS